MNFLRVALPSSVTTSPLGASRGLHGRRSRQLPSRRRRRRDDRARLPLAAPTLALSPFTSVAGARATKVLAQQPFADDNKGGNDQSFEFKKSQGSGSDHKSNRQHFKEVPVDPSILNYVRRIGVGIPCRRRKPGATNRNHDSFSLSPSPLPMIPPPPPFGQGSRVRVVRLEDAATATTTKSSDATAEGKAGAAVMVPEVALLGRCNVGKSTLLNALLYGNKRNPGLSKGPDKAAMSSKPGETKDVTVYQLTKPAASSSSSSSSAANPNRQKPRDPLPHSSLVRLRLVDLPGYGFAHGSASTATSDQQQPSPPARHHRLVQEYLFGLHNSRKTLKRILLLVDARHGLKRADAEFLLGLQQPRGNGGSGGGGGARDLPAPVQIVLTKCDLVPQAHLARRASLVRQDLTECLRREPPGSNLPVMFVSARSVLHQNLRGRGGGRKDGAPWVLSQASSSGVLELQRQLAALALLHP